MDEQRFVISDDGEYRKVWGNHAAISVSDEGFNA